jgi:hypothetical protein
MVQLPSLAVQEEARNDQNPTTISRAQFLARRGEGNRPRKNILAMHS